MAENSYFLNIFINISYLASKTRAITPLTVGAAIDVPESILLHSDIGFSKF